jgi:hypothetical protein
MAVNPIYLVGNGMKILFKTALFIPLILICLYFWDSNPYLFSILILIFLYQILFYKFSKLELYEDQLVLESKTLVGTHKKRTVFSFDKVYSFEFIPYKPNFLRFIIFGLLGFLYPTDKNQIRANFTNNQFKRYHWGGNNYEVQIACEKANEIIQMNFNRRKF